MLRGQLRLQATQTVNVANLTRTEARVGAIAISAAVSRAQGRGCVRRKPHVVDSNIADISRLCQEYFLKSELRSNEANERARKPHSVATLIVFSVASEAD